MEIRQRPVLGTYWRAHRPLCSGLCEVDRVKFALQIVDTPLHASNSLQFAACKCLRIPLPRGSQSFRTQATQLQHLPRQHNGTYAATLTYLLTPWCRVLLEKLTGLQLVKKSPAFHGTRRFITVLTSVRHLSLSWASPIQSIYPHPTSTRSILILSTHLRLGLPSGLFPSGFSTKTLSYAAISFIKVFPDCNTSHKIRRFGMSLGLM